MDLIYTWLYDIGDDLVTNVALHENVQKKLAGVNNCIHEGGHNVRVINYTIMYNSY
jgi:predicted esterase